MVLPLLDTRHVQVRGWAEDGPQEEMLLRLSIKIKSLASNEESQDLVEYALVVVRIAFAGTVEKYCESVRWERCNRALPGDSPVVHSSRV